MLPAQHRLTRGGDLRRVSRAGRRYAGVAVVLHVVTPSSPGESSVPARVGFVVGRAVGGSVVRHRVRRRLRHLCRERLPVLPAGSALVVRALPAAAEASYQELGAELDRCLERALGGRGPTAGTVS